MLTGRGGDFLIIDDPLNPEEAASDVQRQRVNDWFDGTLLSRLIDKRRGCIVVIMRRLHEDDLVGHLLDRGGDDWEVLSFPAIAERDETFAIRTPLGVHTHARRAGDVLPPEREPLAVLEELRRSLGAYNFAGQYEQSLRPLGGGMIREGWFGSYTAETRPAAFERIVQSWDTASKATELADFSVCTTWGATDDDRYFLLDVFREKLEYPALKRMVVDLHARWQPRTVLIEDNASGIQLIQDLRHDGLHAATPYMPQAEKVMRLLAQTPTIEQGRVNLPDHAPWHAAYVYELTSFPKARHDDQADSTAQAFVWLARGVPNHGLLRYAQQDLRRMRAGGYQPGCSIRSS
ncbi:MAG: phage terminase large subunit [Sphingomonadaceae bacterium]|nr:phage terminase large subunit [Sphingomonadaceae bacterium]